MKNWKTSVAGVLMFLPTVLHAAFPNVVTAEIAGALSTLFGSLGLVAAHDANAPLK